MHDLNPCVQLHHFISVRGNIRVQRPQPLIEASYIQDLLTRHNTIMKSRSGQAKDGSCEASGAAAHLGQFHEAGPCGGDEPKCFQRAVDKLRENVTRRLCRLSAAVDLNRSEKSHY